MAPVTILLLCSAAVGLCSGCQQKLDAATAGSWAQLRARLELGAHVGISGLALQPPAPGGQAGADEGRIWAVPERQPVLLPLVLGNSGGQGERPRLAGPGLPIEGIDAGLDTESVDWMHPDRVAFGTEAHTDGRPVDFVLIAHLRQDRSGLVVRERVAVPYALWGTTGRRNQGIEGLCSASGYLFLAIESVLERGGSRHAPIARVSLADGSIAPSRLRLATATGKVSALACRPGPTAGQVEALALERHYGVARLLRFDLPLPGGQASPARAPGDAAAPPGIIEPSDVIDLVPVFGDDLPNLEGLLWRPDGTVLLTSDNDTHGVTGPTEAVLLSGMRQGNRI